MLKVELALGDSFRCDDMACDMALKGISNTDLDIACMLPREVLRHGGRLDARGRQLEIG